MKVVLRDYSTGTERLWYTVTPAFEAYSAGHISSYGIAATEGSPGEYSYTVPSMPASTAGIPYVETVYQAATSSLATTDLSNGSAVWREEFEWSGSTVSAVTVGSLTVNASTASGPVVLDSGSISFLFTMSVVPDIFTFKVYDGLGNIIEEILSPTAILVTTISSTEYDVKITPTTAKGYAVGQFYHLQGNFMLNGVETIKPVGPFKVVRSADPDNVWGATSRTITGGTVTTVGSGTGADEVTLTFTKEGSVPIADADVWITSDAGGDNVVAGTLQTDSSGQVTFLLDAGSTYYSFLQKDGINSIRGQSFVAQAD